jgi:GT2 family glycosyltransferase
MKIKEGSFIKMDNRITIHIATRDRHTELGLLLQSLRTQTYQNFDILIVDDASGAPVTNCYFVAYLLNRLKLEGHKVKMVRNNISFGCCYARNMCIKEDDFNNYLTLRLDDDVILASDYIEKLYEVIISGYDIASGVVPMLSSPEIKREIRFVKPIINEHKLDEQGNLIMNKDDCGACYIEHEILPTDQFRTNCLYKTLIHSSVNYPENLTSVAFREEGFFSLKAIIEGYKIGVHTGAVAFHLSCPSGGNRRQDYNDCVKLDDDTFRKWIKTQFQKHGNFLEKYHKEILK